MLRDPRILDDTLSPDERAAVDAFAREARARHGKGLLRLALFGSRARGDQCQDSDTDLLAVVASNVRGARSDLRQLAAELNLEHDSCLSVVVLEKSEWTELCSRERRFAHDVESEGIDL